MAISKQTWEKIAAAIAVAITVGMAKRIYRKLRSPSNYIFLALVTFFYSIFVFLLLMAFVAGRIRIIAETFPQFTIFTSSWLFIPFAIVSLAFIYIFLILLLRWYFEKKPLSEVAGSFVKSVARNTKAAKDTVATGIKASAVGAKKAAKKTAGGVSTAIKVPAKGVGKAGSAVKKAVSSVISKPVQQEHKQQIDSGEGPVK
jgi:hypothetical protein